MHTELQTSTKLYPPFVGMMSLVGIYATDYPISYGNYCSIAGDGPYLCNMWAENLKEWAKRNPDSGPIEITTVKHGDSAIGYVSDERLKDWCNKRPCVTGCGWPSVAAMRLICATLGFPEEDVCGCEEEYQRPRVSQSYHTSTPKTVTNRCAYCGRNWEGARASNKEPETP